MCRLRRNTRRKRRSIRVLRMTYQCANCQRMPAEFEGTINDLSTVYFCSAECKTKFFARRRRQDGHIQGTPEQMREVSAAMFLCAKAISVASRNYIPELARLGEQVADRSEIAFLKIQKAIQERNNTKTRTLLEECGIDQL